jgi:uroporphyrinogen-III synthase
VSSLHGRSVVITRSRAQAGPFARAIAERGAVPVLFPTIEIRPLQDWAALDRALSQIDRYAWLVFTSVNTVEAVWDRLRALGRSGLGDVARIAAIGPATAQALGDRGATIDAMPETHGGAAIAAALGELARRPVLLPRSDIGRVETAESLRAAGAVVEEIVAYHTTPARPDPDGLEALHGTVDAVTFTSPSTVRNFMTLAGPASRELLARTLIACIGPATAAAVIGQGLAPPLEATIATSGGLLDALEEHFALHPETA